jgi:hypothetical protein
MLTQQELRQTILKNLAIGHLSIEIQDKILEKLGENITKRITIAVLENLPEDAQSEFDLISTTGDEIKMQEFLKSKIPGVEELIQKTIQFTINEFKEIAGIK